MQIPDAAAMNSAKNAKPSQDNGAETGKFLTWELAPAFSTMQASRGPIVILLLCFSAQTHFSLGNCPLWPENISILARFS
jgi:hypothetical protein